MKPRWWAISRWRAKRAGGRFLGADGAVAVEFAILAPILAILAVGIGDFGALMNGSEALAAATRIGAQYARDNPTCQAGIQVLNTPPVSTACRDGIRGAMQNSMSFNPALTFPANFTLTCECDDGTAIACGNNSCATLGRPAPNRMFITVSASQAFTPLITWPGMPAVLNGGTELRLQ